MQMLGKVIEDRGYKFVVEIVYTGYSFVVAQATATKTTKTGKEIIIIGEGISRRSYLDYPNPAQGSTIATGRALKALALKVCGNHISPLLGDSLLMA